MLETKRPQEQGQIELVQQAVGASHHYQATSGVQSRKRGTWAAQATTLAALLSKHLGELTVTKSREGESRGVAVPSASNTTWMPPWPSLMTWT